MKDNTITWNNKKYKMPFDADYYKQKADNFKEEIIVNNRFRGAGCKYCRSLVYLYPERAKEWHPTKNEDLKPD